MNLFVLNIILAAILHDIGWSAASEKERYIVARNPPPEVDYPLRIKHEKEGVRLAREILETVGFDKVDRVLEIIDGHDTRDHFKSIEDGIVRDADKLFRYTDVAIEICLRRGFTLKHLYDDQLANIDKPNFFYSEISKEIARKELEKEKWNF